MVRGQGAHSRSQNKCGEGKPASGLREERIGPGGWAQALRRQPCLPLPWDCVQGPPRCPLRQGQRGSSWPRPCLWEETNLAVGSEHGGPGMRESVLGTSGSRWGSAPCLLTARPQVPVCSELIGPPHLGDAWLLSPPPSQLASFLWCRFMGVGVSYGPHGGGWCLFY